MRELKFRAWDQDKKEFIYDFQKSNYQLLWDSENEKLFCGGLQENGDWNQPVLNQFTGFRSKITKAKPQGDKIYEGDIIKFHKNSGKWLVSLTAIIIFERGAFYAYWEREMLGKTEKHYDLLTRYDRRYLRVIGNIYQNTDLI